MKQADYFLTGSTGSNLDPLTQEQIEAGFLGGTLAKAKEVNAQLNRHEKLIFSANRELINVLDYAGISPNQNENNQLLTALDLLYTGVPIGVEVFTMLSVAPSGFIFEEGQELLRATYPNLWSFANDNGLVNTEAEWLAGEYGLFSDGDGSTTFRLPDMRGQFIRVQDNGAGLDPDAGARAGADTNGSVQSFAMENLVGTATSDNFARNINMNATGCMTAVSSGQNGTTSSGVGVRVGIDASLTNQTSTETRPVNINRKLMIKY